MKYVQIFSSKMAPTLKRNEMVVYPVHVVLLNCSLRFRRRLIESDFTQKVFLPVQCAEEEIVEDLVKGDTTYETYSCSNEKTLLPSDAVRLTSSQKS